MTGRAVERVWSALTSRWLLWGSLVVVAAMLAASMAAEQVSLDVATGPEELGALLPGWFAMHDLRHSAVFLSAALVLAVALVTGAADRLLSSRGRAESPSRRRSPSDGWERAERAAGVGARLALAVAVVAVLGHGFVSREVDVPLAPQETALLPTLDGSVRAQVTGWTPEDGLLATVEVAPRLAGGELAGPFGDRDRAVDAPLAYDSVAVELRGGETAGAHGLRLRLDSDPPAWAVRIRVARNGVDATSPFLQTGQSWEAAALPTGSPVVVAVDRVLPRFDPTVPITRQSLSGAADDPAAVVTLHEGGEVVGSRALAPGGQAVFGDVVVLVEGFAPVVAVTVGRGAAWTVAAAVAAATAVLCACVWAVSAVHVRRRRT